MRVGQYMLEGLLIFLIMWAFISQLVLPAIRGTKLFPMFRREHKIKKEIIEEATSGREQDLSTELELRRRAREATAQELWAQQPPAPPPTAETPNQQDK